MRLSLFILSILSAHAFKSFTQPFTVARSRSTSAALGMTAGAPSSYINELKKSVLSKISETCSNICLNGKQVRLVERPGFSYSLGSREWKSSGYKGEVQGYEANPLLRWLSVSTMGFNTTNELRIQRAPYEYLRIDAFVSTMTDIPHLKMGVAYDAAEQRWLIELDYSPRVDLVSHMQYFDTYYTEIQYKYADYLQSHNVNYHPLPYQFPISSIVTSPIAFHAHLDLNLDHTNTTIITELINQHVVTWCHWIIQYNNASNNTNTNSTRIIIDAQREESLRILTYDEIRFQYAAILGLNFAPKATDIANGIVGPEIDIIL